MDIRRFGLLMFLAAVMAACLPAFPPAARAEGEDAAQQLALQAQGFLENKQYEEAIEVYEKILETRPDDEQVLYNMACAYALYNDPKEAIAYLQKAVEAGFADFEMIQADPDLKSLRNIEGFTDIIRAKDFYLKKAAERKVEELKKTYGKGYSYEIDEKRKLIYASDSSEGLMNKIQDFLNKFADAERGYLFKNKPSYYITILVPNQRDFVKQVPNPGIGGFYAHSIKTLFCRDTGYTLRHEFTHALYFADISARKQTHPIWIVEGLSTCFEESELGYASIVPSYNGRIDQMKDLIKNKRTIPWSKLAKMDQKAFMDQAGSCYAEVRSIFYWLDKTNGLKNFYFTYLSDLSNSKDNYSGIPTLERIYGKKIERIEDEWERWVAKTPAPEVLENKNDTYVGVAAEASVAGMIITAVGAGSPAEQAGLKVKDVILKMGADKIDTVEEYLNAIRKRMPGDVVTFTVLRDNAEKLIKVKLGKRPKDKK
ncbi:MAG: PDZ domain-containing protein [Candidatus Brocadiia bacterium]